MSDEREPPKASKGDVAHKAAKMVLSAVPVVGGPAVELFASLVLPPLQKPRDEWMESVGEAIGRLEEDGKIKVSDLRENDEFPSVPTYVRHMGPLILV